MVGQGAARFAADHRGADAAVDGERRAQRRPEHLRLADQVDHLRAGPQVVGAGLHWDQYAFGGQQCRAGEGGDARWPVDDHVIGATSQLRGFLMQCLARQADGAEQPGQALLAAPLRPVQHRALWVGIEQDDVLSAQGQFAGDMGGEGGLAHPAFLVEQGDDHGRVSLAKPPQSEPVHKQALAQ
ncbi:hypothetical protein D9M68_825640 [compost metagenome]